MWSINLEFIQIDGEELQPPKINMDNFKNLKNLIVDLVGSYSFCLKPFIFRVSKS